MTLRPGRKRSWPRRLVGDSPGLRARFRDEYPTIRIDLEPGSAYRAWLNAHRRAARPLGQTHRASRRPSKPKPPTRGSVADNALLRAAYARRQNREKDYPTWLYDEGIDPDTGKMNASGVEFYKLLLERQHREN